MAMPSEAKAEQVATQEINERLTALHDSFSKISDRMQRVVDRAFGTSTASQSAGAIPRAVPSGEIGAIKERLNDLSNLASEQSTLLNRIDTIV